MRKGLAAGFRLRNIRENGLLILSGIAFMGLNLQRDPLKIAAFPAALAAIVLFFDWMEEIPARRKMVPAVIRCFGVVSAAGICLYTARSFISRTANAIGPGTLSAALTGLAVVAGALALPALYTLVSLLLGQVWDALLPLLRKLTRAERILYTVITAALMGFVCYAFLNSSAFWTSEVSYELLYTSDSPGMIEPNVYLWLYHPENDLRQPLFTVFAAPLLAPAWLLSFPFSGLSPVIVPLCLSLSQIPMLVMTSLMLTGMMKLESRARICLMLLISVCYPTLLFVLMTEQYIVACFWLIFALYTWTEGGQAALIAIPAAGGTLLTSLALLPTAYEPRRDGKGIRAFILAVARPVLAFAVLFFAFGRMDTLLSFGKKAGILASFAGGGSLSQRLNQYLAFVASCFAAPRAAADTATYGYPSWQLTGENLTHLNGFGLAILFLCAISLILHRRDRAARAAGAWAGFSALLLLVIGWGAPENGMVLYSLYFGWAFWVLLFRLIQWAGKRLDAVFLTPLASCTIIILLFWLNARGIGELLSFAFAFYPY